MVNFLNRVISWSFYSLFFFIPFAFTSDTSELFEFNKLWLTFALTIIIVCAWVGKMIFEKRIHIQRTLLDIPIGLFLLSQLISTIISLDPHTSFWGYYSRFNGGFLSLFTYVLLFYAFVSNVKKELIFRYLLTAIFSGILVSLWGLPSHFGYDPTCLLFRGTFDVSCWTFAFQPKVRIFSTLGQPDWLSAYLAALIPLSIGFGLYYWDRAKKLIAGGFLLATILFYVDFLYARSRGGFVGLALSLIVFFGWYLWKENKQITKLFSAPTKFLSTYWYILVMLVGIVGFTFIIGSSVDQIDTFDLTSVMNKLHTHSVPVTKQVAKPTQPASTVSTGELGGTDSGKIRLFVWTGALKAWEHYPIFGTGVETFAYAYYLFMPPGHNLTSEFGYLYNKAHNEYLNYLATTGAVGLGTYLLMIGWFLWVAIKRFTKDKANNSQSSMVNGQYVTAGLLVSYIGILIINFFGFSVVIINLFLFLFPGLVFLLQDQIDEEKAIVLPKYPQKSVSIGSGQWILSCVVGAVGIYLLYTLIVFWNADKAYALGQNLVNAGDYQSAYQPLHQAVQLRPGEPTFQDEMSLDDAVLAVGLVQQDKKVTETATQLAQEAIITSDNLTTNHPNIVTFWKTRVRIMYTLSQLNPQYMQEALAAIHKAAELAPTDAKVSYNLGLVEGQTGHLQDAVATLQNTIRLKKDYSEAYYALGIFYHSLGVDKNGKVTDPIYAQKAIDTMHFILDNFGVNQQASDALKAWGAK